MNCPWFNGSGLLSSGGPKKHMAKSTIIPTEQIQQNILLVRGHKVMLSTHLAILYGVQPKVLMQAVKRNANRFPADFMFQLTADENVNLKSQSVTLIKADDPRSQSVSLNKRGQNTKYLPYAFTDYGVAMLSSILNSDRAVEVNIQIMRAFVRVREMLASNAELTSKLVSLERKYDSQFKIVFDAIRQLMTPPTEPSKPRIGYQTEEQKRNARSLRASK
jgi:hypothetical protein